MQIKKALVALICLRCRLHKCFKTLLYSHVVVSSSHEQPITIMTFYHTMTQTVVFLLNLQYILYCKNLNCRANKHLYSGTCKEKRPQVQHTVKFVDVLMVWSIRPLSQTISPYLPANSCSSLYLTFSCESRQRVSTANELHIQRKQVLQSPPQKEI